MLVCYKCQGQTHTEAASVDTISFQMINEKHTHTHTLAHTHTLLHAHTHTRTHTHTHIQPRPPARPPARLHARTWLAKSIFLFHATQVDRRHTVAGSSTFLL